MRVLIMSDMEGVSGIVVWNQVTGGDPMFEEGRQLYTEEINAAVRGARADGATEVVVVDCHGAGRGWSFNSLVPEKIHPDCEWVAHHGWGRYDDRNLWFNDDLVGETGVNAALNGHYGVPVALVTGDAAVCREARALLGDSLPTVAVKKGLSRFSARQLAPVRARELIEEAARKALTEPVRTKPYVPERPTTIRIELASVDQLADFKGRAGVETTGPLSVESRAADWMTAWNQFWPLV